MGIFRVEKYLYCKIERLYLNRFKFSIMVGRGGGGCCVVCCVAEVVLHSSAWGVTPNVRGGKGV